MALQEIMYNRKGFLHHPDTPQADKDFYNQHKIKSQMLLRLAEDFLDEGGVLAHRSQARGKEELGTNSRYLHRGVYCPSPVRDILVTNARRGRILVRPTARSHITNRYVYGTDGKLLFVDNYIDDRMVSSEYLLYRDNKVYGVTVGMDRGIVCVSEEQYRAGRIETYHWAYYSRTEHSWECHEMFCEAYCYDGEGLAGWEYYQLRFGWEKIAPSGFIQHDCYRFQREEGLLKSYAPVNSDGIPRPGSVVHEIKIKRKA